VNYLERQASFATATYTNNRDESNVWPPNEVREDIELATSADESCERCRDWPKLRLLRHDWGA
jgi:hypothetical protein